MAVATKTSKKTAAKLSLLASSALLLVGAGCNNTADVNVNTSAVPEPNGAMMEKNDDAAVNGATVDDHKMDDGSTMDDGAMKDQPGAMLQGSYKDGTYDVVGHYKSPAGPEEIKVSLTLKDNVIVDATVTPQATNPKSVFMQNAFAGGYKTLVVGKNIDEVNLVAAVSGSSLTPIGFNEAVAQVKAQAKAS